ncbi:zinc finger and SCAN domain-containing protein 31-like [Acipenser ruthenus]|uniref:zinc finger and SCAN domain-containing protein 31-like n=1 Tax=Acipenser ruthenus TaxID=7906 RepID=UPI0027428615|nr:zinc finger and SCAN domain-containing protein 31-like [Acipenser ruthenus]
MEVSVSVSFFQDELASTIEHAVKAAVDTVLCQITKVVGSKFTEFRMEMAGKEKENESLKLRLEISESELKAVRECMNSGRGSRCSRAGDPRKKRLSPEAVEQPERPAVHPAEGREWDSSLAPHPAPGNEKTQPRLESVLIKEEDPEIQSVLIKEEPLQYTHITTEYDKHPLEQRLESSHCEDYPPEQICMKPNQPVSEDTGSSVGEEGTVLGSIQRKHHPPQERAADGKEEGAMPSTSSTAYAGESTSSLLWAVASGGSRQLQIQSKTTTQEAQESMAASLPDSRVRPSLLGSTETGRSVCVGDPETQCNAMSRRDPDVQIQTGKRPTPCPECGKSFSDSGNLKQHRRIHTGEKPYRCTECGKSFSELGNLKQHQRIHTGEKPYRCAECGKSFTHSNSLKIHERAHTGHTRYICDECGKSFSQFEHLKVHRRIHTGEKPYQCPDCGKRFRHSGVLKKHQRIHTGEKPYHCTECGMRFSRVDYLKAHQRLHA